MDKRECPCGESGVLALKVEMAGERTKALEDEVWGNGRPGLKERVKTMEQTLDAMTKAAEGVRSDTRRAIFAAMGSLVVMAIAFVGAIVWQSMHARDLTEVVRETIRQQASTAPASAKE